MFLYVDYNYVKQHEFSDFKHRFLGVEKYRHTESPQFLRPESDCLVDYLFCRYDIMNYQRISATEYDYIHVGSWISGGDFKMFRPFQWPFISDNDTLPPESVCSKPCPKGQAKVCMGFCIYSFVGYYRIFVYIIICTNSVILRIFGIFL